MELIDKDTLLAEIEKRKEALETSDGRRFNSLSDQILWNAFNSIQDVIDTLEVKEVDLEKEIDFAMPSKYCWSGDGKVVYLKEQMRNFAKYFFELGLKAQKGEL